MTLPTLDDMMVEVLDNQLYVSDYKIILQTGADLTSCDKFNYIKSDVVSDIGSVDNIRVALEDPNGLYKIIQLSNIVSADVLIKNNSTNDTLFYSANYTGSVEHITQSSASEVYVVVSRENYSNWIVGLDLSQKYSGI